MSALSWVFTIAVWQWCLAHISWPADVRSHKSVSGFAAKYGREKP
jgi:hypothetical protein